MQEGGDRLPLFISLNAIAIYGIGRTGFVFWLGAVIGVAAPEPGCTDGRSTLGVTPGADMTAGAAGTAGTAGVVAVAGMAGVAGIAGITGRATGTETGGVLMIGV